MAVIVKRPVVVAAEQTAMAVAVPLAAPQLAPCRDTDPPAEGDESDTRSRIHPLAEARGKGDTGSPNNQPDDQGGRDVAGAGQQGGAGRLALRPAALPGNQGDRHPMVGHNGMKHADDGDGEDEQEAGSAIHRGSLGRQEERAHATRL
jgi:hypothetical protein